MKPLTARKQLLIAESELNREQLVQEWRGLSQDVNRLADRAGTVPAVVSAAVTLLTGLATLRQKKAAPAPAKKPWWQTLLKGVQMAGSLWSSCQPPDRKRTED